MLAVLSVVRNQRCSRYVGSRRRHRPVVSLFHTSASRYERAGTTQSSVRAYVCMCFSSNCTVLLSRSSFFFPPCATVQRPFFPVAIASSDFVPKTRGIRSGFVTGHHQLREPLSPSFIRFSGAFVFFIRSLAPGTQIH